MPELPPLPEGIRAALPPEAQAYIVALETTVVLLQAQLATMQARIEVLEAQVAQHSQNSSRPPSADGPSAPPRPKPPKSTRKRGAQAGHRGHHRALLDERQVAQVVEHWPAHCPDCQHALPQRDAPGSLARRQQVWDVPPVQAVVIEHRYHTVRCASCRRPVPA